ncbi:unnamed protein product [Pleuronectes platessa]|uniref:Uncharacterized protein n=1 Tax=Pleuronectes platessa TaxID=8262 RepID=A0A9N7V818_PLEPL|nr:unnamed protein product [Pleuronectes platessa]
MLACDEHTGAHWELISGEEDAANDYAPGHCTISTETSRPGAGQDLQTVREELLHLSFSAVCTFELVVNNKQQSD